MWLLKIVLWGSAIFLFFVGIFGGVLDVAALIGIDIPQWTAVSIAALLLLFEREIKVLTLSWKLNARRDLQRRIDRLAEFRSEVINKLYAHTPKTEDFTTWVKDFETWEKSLVSYLKEEFPYAVFEMHKDVGIKPLMDFEHVSNDPTIKEKHLHYLRMIAKHLSVLETLIKENTAITKEREPQLRDLLSSGPSN
ncbi:MAG: hypothetical protein KAS80_03720 [Anaerolineales bacterium]|nr:hypothetical protein [Anaerolineales bacterium]